MWYVNYILRKLFKNKPKFTQRNQNPTVNRLFPAPHKAVKELALDMGAGGRLRSRDSANFMWAPDIWVIGASGCGDSDVREWTHRYWEPLFHSLFQRQFFPDCYLSRKVLVPQCVCVCVFYHPMKICSRMLWSGSSIL